MVDHHHKRLRAYKRGHRAEWLAACALMIKGYRITAMRYKTRHGEVDIIARKRDVVVFVEVKARATQEAALNSISRTAQTRIEAAAQQWIAEQDNGANLSWRFDVMTVQPWRWPNHFIDVW